jgi:hypothetical protein
LADDPIREKRTKIKNVPMRWKILCIPKQKGCAARVYISELSANSFDDTVLINPTPHEDDNLLTISKGGN